MRRRFRSVAIGLAGMVGLALAIVAPGAPAAVAVPPPPGYVFHSDHEWWFGCVNTGAAGVNAGDWEQYHCQGIPNGALEAPIWRLWVLT